MTEMCTKILNNDTRLRTSYRRIKLFIDDSNDCNSSIWFDNNVSFNTVPTVQIESNYDKFDTEFPGLKFPVDPKTNQVFTPSDMNQLLKLNNSEGFYRNQGFRTHRDPNSNVPFNEVFLVTKTGKIIRRDYPSDPYINNEAFLINKSHPLYGKTWHKKQNLLKERLDQDNKFFRYPELLLNSYHLNEKKILVSNSQTLAVKYDEQRPKREITSLQYNNEKAPRTILCHINGRKHTWVAMDWLITKYANETDHIIIITNLPRLLDKTNNCRKTTVDSWSTGYDKNRIDELLDDLQHYLKLIIPTDKIIRITIDVSIGKTSKILTDAINVYQPNLIILSTLKWQRTESLIKWKSSNLNDILVTKFPVPVCLVPAKRMYQFELLFQNKWNCQNFTTPYKENYSNDVNEILSIDSVMRSYSTIDGSNSLELNEGNTSEIESIAEIQSINTDDSQYTTEDDFNYSYIKLLNLARNNRTLLKDDLSMIDDNEALTILEKKINKIDILVKNSLRFSIHIDENFLDTNKATDNLKKILTGGSKIMRPKSMVECVSPSDDNRNTNQIKFALDVKNKDGYKSLGNHKRNTSLDEAKNDVLSNNMPLRKTQSTDGLRKKTSIDSATSISSTKSADCSKRRSSFPGKSKQGGFFSFLKSSNSNRDQKSSRRNSDDSNQSTSNNSSRRVSRLFGLGKY